MKKLLTFVFLFIIGIQFSFGQTYLGLKAGGNVANMKFVNGLLKVSNTENENKMGYQVGIIAQEQMSNKVYVRSELFYSLKGYKLDDEQGTTVDFHYINLPVLIGYKLSSNFSAFLGPQLGYLAAVYSKDENRERSDNLRNVYNEYDLGIGVGVSYILTPRISVDLRYNYGLTNILVTNFIDSSGNKEVSELLKNNRSLEISFNYFFRPKR